MKRLLGVLAGLGLMAALVGVAVAASGNKFSNQTITHNCTDRSSGGGMMGDDMDGDGDTITFQGPTKLWPPNHKYQSVRITATDSDNSMESLMDDSNDQVTLTTTATSNQPELGHGSGHTTDDATPAMAQTSGDESASQVIQLRSERAGVDPTKTGRTYTITATATYDSGSMEQCHATFTVTVPHDMGH